MLTVFFNPVEWMLTGPVKKAESVQIYNVRPVTNLKFQKLFQLDRGKYPLRLLSVL